MSASLFWKPVDTEKYQLTTGAPSSFMSRLELAFGNITPLLGDNDIPTLRGLAIGVDDIAMRNDFNSLADAIVEHGEIQVVAVY